MVDERDLRSRNGNWDDDNWNDNAGNNYGRAMNESEFSQLMQKMRSQWLNSQKMQVAREAVSRDMFSTAQVRQLIQLISSESDKLELAKLAYRNTVDNRNYAQLYDVFAYQSSREELERYIRNSRF